MFVVRYHYVRAEGEKIICTSQKIFGEPCLSGIGQAPHPSVRQQSEGKQGNCSITSNFIYIFVLNLSIDCVKSLYLDIDIQRRESGNKVVTLLNCSHSELWSTIKNPLESGIYLAPNNDHKMR